MFGRHRTWNGQLPAVDPKLFASSGFHVDVSGRRRIVPYQHHGQTRPDSPALQRLNFSGNLIFYVFSDFRTVNKRSRHNDFHHTLMLMSFVLTLLLVFTGSAFESTIDKAFTSIQNNDWPNAGSALDEAYSSDAATFDANNFHYLRGRIAESQNDWQRAREEFSKVGTDNPLRALASWHAARASIRLHDDASAEIFFSSLPTTFPSDLRTQLARESGVGLAQKIYQDLSTREGRFQRAKAASNADALWSLIRESKDDDVAIESARLLVMSASSPGDLMQLSEVFANHRVF